MMSFVRRASWRLGRKLYGWGRGEHANAPERNGEYWLLAQVLSSARSDGVILDVGANVGNWSKTALTLADQSAKRIALHAFEPSSETRRLLAEAISAHEGVRINALALSSTEGVADFFSSGVGSGTNSLDASSGDEIEQVRISTIDRYLEENEIECVAMIKVDTEGFDLEVIKGAGGILSKGGVELLQFEYNWRWLLNRASMREVFEFMADKPYKLGRLMPESIWIYDAWHFELDKFFEDNYVLIRSGSPLERLCVKAVFDASNTAVPAK